MVSCSLGPFLQEITGICSCERGSRHAPSPGRSCSTRNPPQPHGRLCSGSQTPFGAPGVPEVSSMPGMCSAPAARLQRALPGLPPAVARPGSSQGRQPEEPLCPYSLYLGCRELAWSFLCLFHLKTTGNGLKQPPFSGLITTHSITALLCVSLRTVPHHPTIIPCCCRGCSEQHPKLWAGSHQPLK